MDNVQKVRNCIYIPSSQVLGQNLIVLLINPCSTKTGFFLVIWFLKAFGSIRVTFLKAID
jgi:hypothetical protein